MMQVRMGAVLVLTPFFSPPVELGCWGLLSRGAVLPSWLLRHGGVLRQDCHPGVWF